MSRQAKINDKRSNEENFKEVYEYREGERETVIRFDPKEKEWYMWTNIQSHITKAFQREGYDIEITSVNNTGTITSIMAKFSKSQISFRKKSKR